MILHLRIENTQYDDFDSYDGPIEITNSDTWVIHFYSVDMMGHIEETQTLTISRYSPVAEFLPIIIVSSIAGLAGVAVVLTILLLRKRKRSSIINP